MSYSIDPKDWTLPGVEAIVSRVVGAAFPGAVVDMHDAGGDRSQTVAALPQIISNSGGWGTRSSQSAAPGPISDRRSPRPMPLETHPFPGHP